MDADIVDLPVGLLISPFFSAQNVFILLLSSSLFPLIRCSWLFNLFFFLEPGDPVFKNRTRVISLKDLFCQSRFPGVWKSLLYPQGSGPNWSAPLEKGIHHCTVELHLLRHYCWGFHHNTIEVLLLYHSPLCPGLCQAEHGFLILGPGWQRQDYSNNKCFWGVGQVLLSVNSKPKSNYNLGCYRAVISYFLCLRFDNIFSMFGNIFLSILETRKL